MRKNTLMDKYLLSKPTVSLLIEWPILIGVGILGTVFSLQRIPFYPVSNILGFLILIVGIIIHESSHKIHKQAHKEYQEVSKLATEGAYSLVRHPGYSGLILMYLGVAFTWGVLWLLIPAIVFSILTLLTAFKEEEVMKKKFGREYEDYMKKVPYRFIPGIL